MPCCGALFDEMMFCFFKRHLSRWCWYCRKEQACIKCFDISRIRCYALDRTIWEKSKRLTIDINQLWLTLLGSNLASRNFPFSSLSSLRTVPNRRNLLSIQKLSAWPCKCPITCGQVILYISAGPKSNSLKLNSGQCYCKRYIGGFASWDAGGSGV